MEFPFDCSSALGADGQGFAVLDAKAMKRLLPGKCASLLIDTFGQLSAKALSMNNVVYSRKLWVQ